VLLLTSTLCDAVPCSAVNVWTREPVGRPTETCTQSFEGQVLPVARNPLGTHAGLMLHIW
jgi:hypothetical protein